MKVLYVDSETTGLDPKKNDIISLAGIIEIDRVVKEEFYLEIQPFDYSTISEEALKVNGMDLNKIKTFISPRIAYKQIIHIFSKYINKFNKNDKFIAIGHNVKFDIDFLSSFFLKNDDKYFGSWVDYHCVDTMILLNFLKYKQVIDIENVKLVTACAKYNIPLDAHNSLNDIRATKELFAKIEKQIELKN